MMITFLMLPYTLMRNDLFTHKLCCIGKATTTACSVMLCISAAYAVVQCPYGWVVSVCHVRVLCRNG